MAPQTTLGSRTLASALMVCALALAGCQNPMTYAGGLFGGNKHSDAEQAWSALDVELAKFDVDGTNKGLGALPEDAVVSPEQIRVWQAFTEALKFFEGGGMVACLQAMQAHTGVRCGPNGSHASPGSDDYVGGLSAGGGGGDVDEQTIDGIDFMCDRLGMVAPRPHRKGDNWAKETPFQRETRLAARELALARAAYRRSKELDRAAAELPESPQRDHNQAVLRHDASQAMQEYVNHYGEYLDHDRNAKRLEPRAGRRSHRKEDDKGSNVSGTSQNPPPKPKDKAGTPKLGEDGTRTGDDEAAFAALCAKKADQRFAKYHSALDKAVSDFERSLAQLEEQKKRDEQKINPCNDPAKDDAAQDNGDPEGTSSGKANECPGSKSRGGKIDICKDNPTDPSCQLDTNNGTGHKLKGNQLGPVPKAPVADKLCKAGCPGGDGEGYNQQQGVEAP